MKLLDATESSRGKSCFDDKLEINETLKNAVISCIKMTRKVYMGKSLKTYLASEISTARRGLPQC